MYRNQPPYSPHGKRGYRQLSKGQPEQSGMKRFKVGTSMGERNNLAKYSQYDVAEVL